MDFSEAFEYSGCAPCFSPSGRYIAAALGQRVIIRDAVSLRVDYLFTCLDRVCQLCWCPRSAKLLCRLHGKPILQVWSLSQPDWDCKINQGAAGAACAWWSPDARSIIVAADFGIKLAVWSLADRTAAYLNGPKQGVHQNVAFSPDGKIMAVAERADCRDFLSLTSCTAWRTFHRSPTATSDMAGLAWSPDSTTLAIWDSALGYKVLLYGRDGSPKASYSAYDDALGVRAAAWSPGGQLLAVGSCDEVARMLHRATWKSLAALDHPAQLEEPVHAHATIYCEREDAPHHHPHQARLQSHRGGSGFLVQSLPLRLPEGAARPDTTTKLPGIGWLRWSADACWLATVDDSAPRVVWIWDVKHLSLHSVIVHGAAVHAVSWHPSLPQLAIASNTPCLYVWCPEGMTTVRAPMPAFRASKCDWGPDGGAVLLHDLDRFVVAFLETEDEALSPEP